MKIANENNSIVWFLMKWARQTPDEEAIHIVGNRRRSVSYREFEDQVRRACVILRAQGVVAGDHVVILSELDDRFLTIWFAVSALGGVIVPITIDSQPSRHVLSEYGREHRIRCICATPQFMKLASESVADSTAILDFDEVCSAAVDPLPRSDWEALVKNRDPNAIHYLNHTSGSTSNPKMVEAADMDLVANALSCIEQFGLNSDLRHACLFTFHHHEHFIRPLIVGGCSILVPGIPVGRDALRKCVAGKANHLLCNTHVAMHLADESGDRLSEFRGMLDVIEIGGGLVSKVTVDKLRRGTGAKILVCYGSTETSGEALVAIDKVDASVGPRFFALPGVDARIVDDFGLSVPDGTIGELVISAPFVATGYVIPPPGEPRLKDGTFSTGDVAIRNQDGIRVLGRRDHAVKQLGTRQPLEPIEMRIKDELGDHASVVQCVDVEAIGVARSAGLAGSLIVLVRLSDDARKLSTGKQEKFVRKAMNRTGLAAWLTQPVAFVLVDDNELEVVAGKLRRSHGRSCFPFLFDEWLPERRARSRGVRPSAASVGRTVMRLVHEARSVPNPLSLFMQGLWRIRRHRNSGSNAIGSRRYMWWAVLTLLTIYAVLVGVLVVFEDELVFRNGGGNPRGIYAEAMQEVAHEDVYIITEDGVRLHGVFCKCPTSDDDSPVVLYCHGNRGTVLHRFRIVKDWHERVGADVLLFDYRGFGQSEGQPTEKGLYGDSRAAYHWLTSERDVNPSRILIVGRSLGGAVALELALDVPHRGLVLESTFTNLPDVVDDVFPIVPAHTLMKNRFPSDERIQFYNGRLLVAHGERDELISPKLGRRLFELATSPKRFLEVPTTTHMDPPSAEYYTTIKAFFELNSGSDMVEARSDCE